MSSIIVEEPKKKINQRLVGVLILVFLVVLVCIVVGLRESDNPEIKNAIEIYGAVGGGKENLLDDEQFKSILNQRYGINVVNDSWSNGKLVINPVIRENGDNYDFIFYLLLYWT